MRNSTSSRGWTDKKTRLVNNLSVSIAGGIQPERLKDVHELALDGLFQRFLPPQVQIMSAGEETDDAPEGDSDDRLLGMAFTTTAELKPGTLELDELGRKAWLNFSNEMTGNWASTTLPSRAFGEFLAKQARTLGALALILHLMEHCWPGEGKKARRRDENEVDGDAEATGDGGNGRIGIGSSIPQSIPMKTLTRAKKILEEFFMPHAWTFYEQTLSRNDSMRQYRHAAVEGGERRQAEDGAQEPQQDQAIGRLESDIRKVTAVLTPFAANGWISPGTEGPYNQAWALNPALAGRFSGELQRQIDIHNEIAARIWTKTGHP